MSISRQVRLLGAVVSTGHNFFFHLTSMHTSMTLANRSTGHSDFSVAIITFSKAQRYCIIYHETALPQGTGNLVKQEDGSMVLANEHEQGFMVNDAIVEFWKMCNGKRKITELVDLFAKHTGMQRGQVEKEVMQLIQQLREGGLVVISTSPETPNVKFDRS